MWPYDKPFQRFKVFIANFEISKYNFSKEPDPLDKYQNNFLIESET